MRLYGEMHDGAVIFEKGDAEIGSDEPHAGGLEDLYLRNAPEMMRLAFLLTRDAATAEDIAQEAFVRVAGRFRHMRSAGAFDAYLRRTVVNLCMTYHRRQRTAREYALSEQQVADALGCSVTAERSLVFRAMETLRTRIGGDER